MQSWIKGIDFPEFFTDASLATISRGYLQDGETPKMMYHRVAASVSRQLKKPELREKFFDYMWKGWLCPASPVLANCGTDRGLPISCFGRSIKDSLDGIYKGYHEMAMLTKHGGGIGTYWGLVRGRGVPIKGNGVSEGVIPWLKISDAAISATSQGSTRRGNEAVYLDIDHKDIEEFLSIRLPTGDVNRQCLNLHHAVNITDDFMQRVKAGDRRARDLWIKVLELRLKTGEPYIHFVDNTNKQNPECYTANGLSVVTSQLCSEIMLHCDTDHTFVCCLSSVNLAHWEAWKDTDLVETSIWFLDGVMEEFLVKAREIPGFERAVRFAEKSRALGLGVLGYHTMLQLDGTAYDSVRARILNGYIFGEIRKRSDKATSELAKEYGEPEWCKGFGRRNTHCLAIAPTVSNAVISGQVSPGVEPIVANIFAHKTAKGTFIVKNTQLEKVLEAAGENTDKVWLSINANGGSVQHLKFLDEKTKEIFLTAREMNQLALIRQAGVRQKWIDQGQSINIFVSPNVDPKYFHQIHWQAWELGLKSLYYCRSGSILKSDLASREHERKLIVSKDDDDCKECGG